MHFQYFWFIETLSHLYHRLIYNWTIKKQYLITCFNSLPDAILITHQIHYLLSLNTTQYIASPFEASEDSEARENKKALSVKAKSLMWAPKPTSYTSLLLNRDPWGLRRILRIRVQTKRNSPGVVSRPPYTFTYVKKEYKNILTGFYSHHHSD